jgi:predicted cupin superfamily sugar epimerase
MDKETVIKRLGLIWLSERKVYFREVYPAYSSGRAPASDIYYLLTDESLPVFHRNQVADEIFNFYLGSRVEMIQIGHEERVRKVSLGTDFVKGEIPKHIVKGGEWQATKITKRNGWALLGCTCIPGFRAEEVEEIQRNELIKKFPWAKESFDAFF